jgi:glycosyltransferase involved in cell wall biosynthesis
MNIFVNASNIHVGGGKVILNDLITVTPNYLDIQFIFFVDGRFTLPKKANNNIIFKKIYKHLRWSVAHLIESQCDKNDIIIYLTNIPPTIRHKCKTILVQSNRFVIENFTLSGFSIKTRLRIIFERLLFLLNNKKVDYIIVQSNTMSSILKRSGICEDKIKIIAYNNIEEQNAIIDSNNRQEHNESFIYIASGDPHKNHINLIEAWCLLSKKHIFPKLIITIDENTILHSIITKKIDEYDLQVEIKPNMKRDSIINLYSRSKALIFPSVFESYGLPLVEAKQHGIPIIASELDYVRDLVDPDETFDPYSPISIYRSVKRFLSISDIKTNIIDPEEFVKCVINL